MPRKREGKKGPNGHQKTKYTKSFIVGIGSGRAGQRNQVRKMADEEGMLLRPAWGLLAGRENLWDPVASQVSLKVAERRKARRQAQRKARKITRRCDHS